MSFENKITSRRIFKFSSPKLNTNIPHFFICLKRLDGGLLLMSVCTSQFTTVRRFVETRSLPAETIVYIPHKKDDNPFYRDTYVNCNEIHEHTVDEFIQLRQLRKIMDLGDLPEAYFQQIIAGILKSPLIDNEIKDVLSELLKI